MSYTEGNSSIPNRPCQSQRPQRSHAFAVILVMMTAMLVGAFCIPLLTIQYSPHRDSRTLTVSFGGSGSARVIESDITSVIEGAMNTVQGVSNIHAVSWQGGGYVALTFKEGTDMETTRFDVSTRLRQIRNKLPEGTYTSVSGSAGGGGRDRTTILSYTVNADMPSQEIVRYVQDHLVTPLSRVDGVDEVGTSGAMPFEWVLTFDPDALRDAGLTPSHISSALGGYFQNSIVGTDVIDDRLMLVRMRSGDLQNRLEEIPVAKVNGRLYHIGDFATVSYREQTPYSYSRINGLNTIDLYVIAEDGVNTLTVTDAVKSRMAELEATFPDNFAIMLSYDASESLNNELQKIFLRAGISLAILLLFVLIVSRSVRYLLVIGLTIIVNLLSAVIFYNLFGIDIELYSMAGITVSLGIIIDTAIVIADHYTYYGNRSVMGSIAGALLTTIAALLLIFFLPADARANLTDFIWVIVINLTLSMVIAFMFVPALLEKMPLRRKGVVSSSFHRRRRVAHQACRYARTIEWGRSHRWLYVTAIVLLFGLPLYLLPASVHHRNTGEMEADEDETVIYDAEPYDDTRGGLVGLYNSTIGSKWYQRHRDWFEYLLGGTLNIFHRHSGERLSLNRDDEEPEVVLMVYANMPEGCNVQQLNAVVQEMENWLQQFDEISMFRTSLSGTSGTIEIRFKEEYEHTRFPYRLKQELWGKAIRYGGATWQIPALDENDQYLSNSVYRTSWSNSIQLYGYNYDLLYRYAEELIDSLKQKSRVTDAGFSVGYGSYVANEFCIDYDREAVARSGINLSRYYSYLGEQLYDSPIGQIYDNGSVTPVRLTSSETDYFDLWHIRNDIVTIDSVETRLDDVGSITKRRTGMNIDRTNQEYVISVGYEFIGDWNLRYHMEYDMLRSLNKRLPMGFRAGSDSGYYSWQEQKQRIALVLVIILVIYMICASLFESWRHPLVIVLLIPVSFIGMFLAYPIFGVSFGQGGFAAMIMLCGITVNAGIYLTSEYRTICAASGRTGLRTYLKAYNRKIVPTMLTILSTVLGLIPFLFDGRQSPFWFSFAIGVMSGMLFSVIAIVLVMPVFFPMNGRRRP